jgi:uncharacterized protein Yka (UPF0111/DUF47 family)
MMAPRGMIWSSSNSALLTNGTAFFMATGRVLANDDEQCRSDLEFLGSRLVFLIDWNRARKQLRGFLKGADRTSLLLGAATEEVGHRGFLELGGAQLVNQAIEATAGAAMHFGDRLCDCLGDAETLAFLRFVLRATSEGLEARQSHALIHDRIRVALAGHFSNEERQLLTLAADHAGLIFELASLVRDGLHAEAKQAASRVKRAGGFEHDADLLVVAIRDAVRRRPDHGIFLLLLEAADDVADGLEDAAFLLGLDQFDGAPFEHLQSLADLLVEGSQEWIKALGHAGQIGGPASQAETEDFLGAIDRVAAIEHQADATERDFIACSIQQAKDFRQLHLLSAIGHAFEEAADALKHASLILRDHVLEQVSHG